MQRVLEYRLDDRRRGVDMAALPLFEEELVLVTARGARRVRSARDRRRDAAGVSQRLPYRRRLEQWLAAEDVKARRILEFGTFEGIIACVAAGMGVSLMPRTILERRDLGGTVAMHKIAARHARIRTHLVWRRDSEHLPAREAFAAVLRVAATAAGKRPAARRRR